MKNIQSIIDSYFAIFPQDKVNLVDFLGQTKGIKNIFNRKNFAGHIVANALVLNPKNEVLTIFHNKLQMYIQPGGHVDEKDESVITASERELLEETGISAKLDSWHEKNGVPILIESHWIPENLKKNESAHYHHDFMYIFQTDDDTVHLQLDEVSDFHWVKIDEVIEKNPESFIGKSLKRMLNLGILPYEFL